MIVFDHPCTIKSSTWICLIINGNPWIYNLSHARWCDEWSIGVDNTGPLLAFYLLLQSVYYSD